MRRALALALLALLLAPGAAAQSSDPEYPEGMLALLPGWIAEAEALPREGDRAQPWWPEADSFLQKAKASAEAKRLRVTMFHLETFGELVAAQQLMDDARAQGGSEAEQRTYIVQQTRTWHADATSAWDAYRARLKGYDGELRSLRSIEQAFYATDVALTAAATAQEHELLAREFPKQSGVPDGYVLALVRASRSPDTTIGWAEDLLEVAVREEGLPPRIVDEAWTNLSTAALAISGEAPPYMANLDAVARPARESNETTVAIVASLAEQRATRANGMQTIFGDAQTRGLSVVQDAARGMNKQLNNTTLERPRAYGLEGVFTSDAIDRARFSNEFVADGTASLGTVLVGWAALEHATYANTALSALSPMQPPEEEKGTPFAPVALVLLALAALAVLRRR